MGTVMDLLNFSGSAIYKGEEIHPSNHGVSRPPPWMFICNILFILLLVAEWTEGRSVHSGIGMHSACNRKTRAFHILAILIPGL